MEWVPQGCVGRRVLWLRVAGLWLTVEELSALFLRAKTGEDGSGFMAFSRAGRAVVLLAGLRGGQREELRRGLLGFGKVVLRFPGGVQWRT